MKLKNIAIFVAISLLITTNVYAAVLLDDCKVFGNGVNQMWENGEQTYSNNTCILENNSLMYIGTIIFLIIMMILINIMIIIMILL
ncbi:MAG: hypothetical protein LBR15_03120 [Methanobrevibacter sp.]|jgi:hypothetical protein|nr:hypothetical protein [Candidatus Methanovirga australis]